MPASKSPSCVKFYPPDLWTWRAGIPLSSEEELRAACTTDARSQRAPIVRLSAISVKLRNETTTNKKMLKMKSAPNSMLKTKGQKKCSQ